MSGRQGRTGPSGGITGTWIGVVGLVRAQKQNREQRPLFAVADVQKAAINARLYRPEQPVIDHAKAPHTRRQALLTVTAPASTTEAAAAALL